MGGGQSLNFGLAHLDKFGWVGAFSAAPNTKSPAQLVPNPSVTAKNILKLWISCGTSDGLLYVSQQTHDYLSLQKVPHIFSLVQGAGHDWTVWKYGLYHFSQLLFKQSATAVEKNEKIPTYILSQNYPNPFNPVTNISYQLAKDGYVTLKIYDILGKEVASLVSDYKPAGSYNVQFNASFAGGGLSSGIYFYRLQSGSFIEIKKLILMK
jgi:hypothetical protein